MTRLWAQSSLCVKSQPERENKRFFAFLRTRYAADLAEPLRWSIRLIIGAQVPGWVALGSCQACQLGQLERVFFIIYFSLFEIIVVGWQLSPRVRYLQLRAMTRMGEAWHARRGAQKLSSVCIVCYADAPYGATAVRVARVNGRWP